MRGDYSILGRGPFTRQGAGFLVSAPPSQQVSRYDIGSGKLNPKEAGTCTALSSDLFDTGGNTNEQNRTCSDQEDAAHKHRNKNLATILNMKVFFFKLI